MGIYKVCVVSQSYNDIKEVVSAVDWVNMSLKVVGEAFNGIEGGEIIRDLSPDILITDLTLNGQNGLEMIEKNPVRNAIVISENTDFKDVKRALQLRVRNFIEKRNFKKELVETLRKIVQELDGINKKEKTDSNAKNEVIRIPHEAKNTIVARAIDYVNKNYSKNIGLPEVADYAHTTENRLSTLFREQTGTNFLYFLNAIRINKAAELLRSTHYRVCDIAEMVGFSTSSYFTKIFRKYTGYKPSAYRNIA